ncbi:hypothetical protein ACIPUC_13630 [Streptomyces sp. LARHCF249]
MQAGVRRVGAVRCALGALGLLLMGIGAWQLSAVPASEDVGVWLLGALVLHDALVAPLVLAVGFLIAAVPARGVLRGALIAGGSLVLITLPLLLRPGAPPNPSALPLPYGRNLLLVLGAVAISAVLAAVVARRRPQEPGGGAGPGSRPRRGTGSGSGPEPGPAPGRRPEPEPEAEAEPESGPGSGPEPGAGPQARGDGA